MVSKKQVIATAYGTSWISTLPVAIIVGLISLLLVATNPSWTIAEPRLLIGFIAGFVMSLVVQIIVLACIIPFGGIFLYWMWVNAFCDWFLGVTHLQVLDIMRWIPIVIFGIFGAIIYLLFSFLAVIVIGAIVSAIIS